MPIDYDYSKAEDQKNVKTIALDGYIIVYSTNRKIPLFTAERIDGTSLDAIKDVSNYRWILDNSRLCTLYVRTLYNEQIISNYV